MTIQSELKSLKNKDYRKSFIENYFLVPLFSILISYMITGLIKLNFYTQYGLLHVMLIWGFVLAFIFWIDFDRIHDNNVLMTKVDNDNM